MLLLRCVGTRVRERFGFFGSVRPGVLFLSSGKLPRTSSLAPCAGWFFNLLLRRLRAQPPWRRAPDRPISSSRDVSAHSFPRPVRQAVQHLAPETLPRTAFLALCAGWFFILLLRRFDAQGFWRRAPDRPFSCSRDASAHSLPNAVCRMVFYLAIETLPRTTFPRPCTKKIMHKKRTIKSLKIEI